MFVFKTNSCRTSSYAALSPFFRTHLLGLCGSPSLMIDSNGAKKVQIFVRTRQKLVSLEKDVSSTYIAAFDRGGSIPVRGSFYGDEI